MQEMEALETNIPEPEAGVNMGAPAAYRIVTKAEAVRVQMESDIACAYLVDLIKEVVYPLFSLRLGELSDDDNKFYIVRK